MWEGEQAAARLARTFLDAGIADEAAWDASKQNPFEFVKRSLDSRLIRNHGKEIREQFFLDLVLSTTLDRYTMRGDNSANDVSRVFLSVEPDSAGYIVLGPTLRLLETAHPRLPVTFVHLFLGALNRWVRVYDYRDALDRIERLRDWYESDPDGSDVELPDVDRSVPKAMGRRPLSDNALRRLVPTIGDSHARRLMQMAVELHETSRRKSRPAIDEEVRELLMDCGEPVPALVAVFEPHDAIEGCFDEEAQGMLEMTPEPNLIIPLNGDSPESVAEAFSMLDTVCSALSCASGLMQIMPGNARSAEQDYP